MSTRSIHVTLSETLDMLVSRAVRSDIPVEIAEEARAATLRALRVRPGTEATAALRHRAEAYFSAVVQRSAFRGSAGPRASARLIAAAIVADLRQGGRPSPEIFDELERGWGSRLPDELLEEYRLQLCG